MSHPYLHWKTITAHRRLVRRYCFRLGLVRQGLTHDLSKYSPVEFLTGARYYQGYRSPNDEERMQTGVSLAWLHHKGRNRHHFEYWTDYIREADGSVRYGGLKMPLRYIAEMFCDRIAASKIYLGEKYDDGAPYEYFLRGREALPIHPETADELDRMLRTLRDEGEEAAFRYVKGRLAEERAAEHAHSR